MYISSLNLFSENISNYIKSEPIERLLIISPYIKLNALETLLSKISPSIKVSIITTWDLDDLSRGSSDLSVYPYCKDHHYSLYINQRIHLKVICSDFKTCIFGSANITNRGLALHKNYNYELYSEPTIIDSKSRLYLNQIFFESSIVTDNIYSWYIEKLDHLPKVIKNEADPSYILNKECDFLISSLPMTLNPKIFYQLYSSCFDTEDIELMECGIHDKILYNIPDNLSEIDFYNYLTQMFFKHPFIVALLQFIDESKSGRYFGEVKEWIQNNCKDVPIPSRRDLTGNIQVLYQWIYALSNREYVIDIPNYSERIYHDI